MKIYSVNDPEFREFGRVVNNVDFTELVAAMKKTPLPEGVIYEPSVAELEALPVMEALSTTTYGEHPVNKESSVCAERLGVSQRFRDQRGSNRCYPYAWSDEGRTA